MYAIQHVHSCTVITFQFQYVNFRTMLLGNNDSGNMPTQDVTSWMNFRIVVMVLVEPELAKH